ncbi:MAG: hypothetical protein P1U83_11470 [Roseovarius sp.]|nr:hypothetical protein [Roseovarius sp.]
MKEEFENYSAATRAALAATGDQLVERLGAKIEVLEDHAAMVAACAKHIEEDYLADLKTGREKVLIIVPVGPPEQFQVLAQKCKETHLSLDRMTVLLMDEYVDQDGNWIPEDHPLSFRRMVTEAFLDPMPENKRPALAVPDPRDTAAIGKLIAEHGGTDTCYAGVGITGHLAFNDPIPGFVDADAFADLATRTVTLPLETRLLISIARTRGNLDRLPARAVTVGMKEILEARKIRMYVNQDWHATVVRRLSLGPVTAAFPASLIQNHSDWSLHMVKNAL